MYSVRAQIPLVERAVLVDMSCPIVKYRERIQLAGLTRSTCSLVSDEELCWPMEQCIRWEPGSLVICVHGDAAFCHTSLTSVLISYNVSAMNVF